MGKLQAAIDAIHPNSTDEEWTRLLAEAMNAADEIASLRARVAELEQALWPFDNALGMSEDANERTQSAPNSPRDYVRYEDFVSARAILSHQQGGGDGPSDATTRMERTLGAKFKDRDNG